MPTVFSCQFLQQDLRLPQVGCVKALGEPIVDGEEELMSFGLSALAPPQSTQAHGGAQLPGFDLLAARYGQSLLSAGFCLGCVRDGLAQQQGTLEAIRLCQQVTPPAGLDD